MDVRKASAYPLTGPSAARPAASRAQQTGAVLRAEQGQSDSGGYSREPVLSARAVLPVDRGAESQNTEFRMVLEQTTLLPRARQAVNAYLAQQETRSVLDQLAGVDYYA